MMTRIYLGMAVVLLALVMVAGCPPQQETPEAQTEVTPPPTTPAGEMYTVTMQGNQFSRAELVVPAGTAVTFRNDDTEVHTVTPDVAGMAGAPNSDEQYPEGLKAGESYQWTAPADATAGTMYYYHCRFHGQPGDGTKTGTGMAGAVRIGEPGMATGAGDTAGTPGTATETTTPPPAS